MIDYKINNKTNSLILCICGGFLGLHHFYNKQYRKGLLYLFTFGLFYIGWIIDIIRIVKIKESSNNELKKYCINCGIEVTKNDLFCHNCGYAARNAA